MNQIALAGANDAIGNFHKRLIKSILDNNLPSMRCTLQEAKAALGAGGVHALLTRQRILPSPDREHYYTMLQVMRTLLLDHMPRLRNIHSRSAILMLRTHLQAYRGQPIHVAVALKRLDIIGGLLDFHREHCSDVSDQLQAMDACQNTALSLAVRSCDVDTVAYFLRVRERECSGFVRTCILRHSFAKNVPRLIFCSGPQLRIILEKLSGQLLRLCGAGFETNGMLLWWYLYLTDNGRASDVLRKEELYNWALLEPNPFHFMAAVICDRDLDGSNIYLLTRLTIYEESNHWLEPNDISTVRIGGETYASGTAAHFALLNYRPSHLFQMHPGFVAGATLHSMPQPLLDIPQVARGVPVARFMGDLQRHFDVEMLKPNLEQKTPLDCLPPDAHPFLIQTLVELQAAERP